MKKTILLLLAIMSAVTLCACGKSEAAKAADNLIDVIGTVTLESGPEIEAAEKAVASLSEDDFKMLEKTEVLEQSRAEYDALVVAHEETQIIMEVEEKIQAIGSVTPESNAAIQTAREAYEALEAPLKQRVGNYGLLEQAEDDYISALAAVIDEKINAIGTVTLQSDPAILAAKIAYDTAQPEVRARVQQVGKIEQAREAYTQLRANVVIDLIEAIGTVTVDSGEAIKAAEDALTDLSSEEREHVENQATLSEAREAFQTLLEQEISRRLANFKKQEDRFNQVIFYLPTARPAYNNYRCFVLPSIGAKTNNKHVYLCSEFNYAGSQWVFYTKITFLIDGKSQSFTFKYSDINRDNNSTVYEDYNTAQGDKYIDLYKAIAASEETLVLFEGSDRRFDFSVSETDKAAIRDIIETYEMMLEAGYY